MKNVILVGGGASIKSGLELGLWDKLKDANVEIWSINYAFMTMPYIPAKEIWCDRCFFTENQHKLEALSKQGVECITKQNTFYDSIPEIKQYHWTRDFYYGTIDKPLFLGYMGLSGNLALSLAVALGYDIIYLLGYDYGTSSMKDTKTHYYQDTLVTTSHGVNNPSIYMTDTGVKGEVNGYSAYLQSKSKIYNVSVNSNIQTFDKITYPQFFKLLKCDKLEQHTKMYIEQNGRCAICGKHESEQKFKLSVDHNHVTGKVRALLCVNCNIILGQAKENKEVLLKCVDYLRKYDIIKV